MSRQVTIQPRLLRATDAYVLLGGRQVLEDCEAAQWIKPLQRRKRLTLYSAAHLHSCADRIERGEYPGR